MNAQYKPWNWSTSLLVVGSFCLVGYGFHLIGVNDWLLVIGLSILYLNVLNKFDQ